MENISRHQLRTPQEENSTEAGNGYTSTYVLSTAEKTILSKSLNFIPTPYKDNPAKIVQDFLLYDRKLRLKYNFHNDKEDNHNPDTEEDDITHKFITPKLCLDPLSAQEPFLDTKYQTYLLRETCSEVSKMDRLKFLNNTQKQETLKIRLITPYNPRSPNFNEILHDNEGLLLMTRKEAVKPQHIQETYSSANLRHADY